MPRKPETVRPTWWQSKADGLESCPGMLSIRTHVHDDVSRSRTTANTSVAPDLPARDAEQCPRQAGKPNGWVRYVYLHAECFKSIGMKASRQLETPYLPGRARSCTEEPETLANLSNATGIHTHVQSVRIDAKMAAKTAGAIRIPQNKIKRPKTAEIASESVRRRQWRPRK